ncbi:hybrid sensor histidine kinase/response regulator [Crocosphaera chwakensis]|uniref:Circadian input-output histidine kinase CikA n=1 Tax=Crocosphaera chwakensis CCY0110 TaxID=391612 RepID=A3ILE0_9CHRO|nr:response regulator [Crocosphaera chwakensis]EAZ92591.1 Multi-sensor Hybrid Histidine Kinase [Crocosphaera chwakensis CCY0110]
MNRLQILLLEDNPLDAEVVSVTLADGGIDCDLEVVNTRTKFVAALETKRFTLILADYALPGFDGLTALSITRERYPYLPFIFVSASLGEELAIESLKMGATDYVLKQRLERLVPCVKRALQEVKEYRKRKAVETALQESEARLRLAIESAQLGTWDLNLITNELKWDAGCKAMFGLPPEAEISMDVFFERLHPEDRERVHREGHNSLNPVNGGNYNTEYRTIGFQDQVERWVKAKGQVYFDANGTPIRFIGTVLEITEQKQAQRRMNADLQDTQVLQELSTRLISEENIEVIYQEIIETAITLSRADAGSFQWFDVKTNQLKLLATQGFSQRIIEHFDRVTGNSQTSCGQALRNGKRAFIDFDAPDDPDGCLKMHLDEGFFSAQSTPLISRSGQFIGLLSTHWRKYHRPSERELRFLDLLARQATDLIEQRQAFAEHQHLLEREQAARKEAEQANRIKDEFLAMLSHELRSPLNPILGWSTLLQTKKFDSATTQKGLSTIERNAKLQTQLIDDLLDIARILRGKLKLKETTVNLVTVIEEGIEVVRRAAEAKSIALRFNLIDSCQVRGDEGRLEQVLWNLLSNAVKFTPEGGQVIVQLEVLHDQACITVVDTGKGIKPEFLPDLFQTFCQEDISITRNYGGLGLGLAIVKYLVDAHGGSITAESAGEGQGATFTVQFPLLKEESKPSPTLLASVNTDLKGIKVLAVDDNEDTRHLLKMLLISYGAETNVVASGIEVLANLKTFDPDVLICDISMPEMDGYTLLQQIRVLPDAQGGKIPAIAVTAFTHYEDRQKALAQGFQEHIPKPLNPEMLATAIARLV